MGPYNNILDVEFLLSERKRTYRQAPLFKRMLNLIIDYMMILHFSIFVGVLLGILFVAFDKTEWIFIFENSFVNFSLSWSLIFFYYAGCEFFLKGKTLGKFATKTRVRNITGSPPSIKSILFRSALRLIPMEPFSIFFGKRQGWHDEFSSTMVVED